MCSRVKWIVLSAAAWVLGVGIASAQEAKPPAPSVEQIREAIRSQLPAPPEGFAWQLYKNAVFPKPVEWREQQMASSTAGIPITAFDWARYGTPILSKVNVLPNVPAN